MDDCNYIVAWLYEPGMPLAIPISYSDEPSITPIAIQVVAPVPDNQNGQFWDYMRDYKEWLIEQAKL